MMTFVAIIHIVIAVVLVALVLVQDSKGGGALGVGGGSNSLLGATGAQTLAARATRWTAALFALTCISLTVMTAGRSKSVLDSGPLPPSLPAAPLTAPAAPATPPAGEAPAAAPTAPPAGK